MPTSPPPHNRARFHGSDSILSIAPRWPHSWRDFFLILHVNTQGIFFKRDKQKHNNKPIFNWFGGQKTPYMFPKLTTYSLSSLETMILIREIYLNFYSSVAPLIAPKWWINSSRGNNTSNKKLLFSAICLDFSITHTYICWIYMYLYIRISTIFCNYPHL